MAYRDQQRIIRDDIVMEWQLLGVLGSRLAMLIDANAPKEQINQTAKEYNTRYIHAIKRSK